MDRGWFDRRRQLQERFEALHPIRDASHFAYMRGPLLRFSEERARELWAGATDNAQPGALSPLNHVYVHVPFCKSICTFCNYERLELSHPNLMKGWLKRVLGSIETLAPAVAPLRWQSLYIGGGTPSTLPAAMLDELLSTLEDRLDFAPRSGRHIELDPAVVSQTRLDVLKKHGFTRFSFGIQSLDAEVNAAHNRGRQGNQIVDDCFSDLRGSGFQSVTVDFLLGLHGTTPDGILADIAYVLETHEPLSVDVFALVPTRKYVDALFGGDLDAFWAHMAPFQEVVPAALPELCARHGYRLNEESGHAYTLHRLDRSTGPGPRTSYTQLVSAQQRPLNLLGLGTSARTQIFQSAAFQYRDPGQDPGGEGPAWYEGQPVPAETEIRSYLIHQLRDLGYIDRPLFRDIFGIDVLDAVAVPVSAWRSIGVADVTQDRISLVNQDTPTRARTLLWLVPDAQLEYEIGRIEGLDLSGEGLEAMFSVLPQGTKLSSGYSFAGVGGGRLHLAGEGHRIRLRLAPALQANGSLRLIVETPPPAAAAPHLGTAVKKLRVLATRQHRSRRR